MNMSNESVEALEMLKDIDPDGCMKCVVTLRDGSKIENLDGWASGRSGGMEVVDWQQGPIADRAIYMAAISGMTPQQLDGCLIETTPVLPPVTIETLRIANTHEYPGRTLWRMACVDAGRAQ